MAETRRPTTPRERPAQASPLQASQQELVARALERPGVAEVIELYSRFAPYVPPPTSPHVVIRHNTGGNI